MIKHESAPLSTDSSDTFPSLLPARCLKSLLGGGPPNPLAREALRFCPAWLPIGLTLVRLLGCEGNRLCGVDMMDGTSILDIKPYLSSVLEAELKRGWLVEAEARRKDGTCAST